MLVLEFCCTLNIKFSTAVQWILSKTRGQTALGGPLGFVHPAHLIATPLVRTVVEKCYVQVWSRTKTLQYRCVDDVVRYRQVSFVCDNGETRSHRIRVVRSCKCKRYTSADNRVSGSRGHRRTRHRKRSSRRSAAQSD